MQEKLTLVIVGPTAVGKSNFVYSELADFSPHIISADSMQIYQGLDIATATPPPKILSQFPHSGINELPPDENYNVARFLERADQAVKEARAAGNLPVLVGGTAMYVKSFLYGLDEMPDANPDFRGKMNRRAEASGPDELHRELAQIDPPAAKKIHPNDQKRIIRALEIHHETGKTKTELISGENKLREALNPYIVGLNRSREELHARISARIDKMLKIGLLEEIFELREQKNLNKNIRQAIGFREAKKYQQGELELKEMKDEMTSRTRELARKQLTWFRRLPVDIWGHPEQDREELVQKIEEKIQQ